MSKFHVFLKFFENGKLAKSGRMRSGCKADAYINKVLSEGHKLKDTDRIEILHVEGRLKGIFVIEKQNGVCSKFEDDHFASYFFYPLKCRE